MLTAPVASSTRMIQSALSGAAPTPSGMAASPSSAAAAPAGPPTLLWPAPSDPLERTVEAGLKPAPKEYKVNHVHAHLDVFIDGKAVLVPAGVGINIKDPEVIKRYNDLGFVMTGSTPEAYAEKLKFETERWTKVVKDNGIKIE